VGALVARLEAYAKPGSAEKWAKLFHSEGWNVEPHRAPGETRYVHANGATARIFANVAVAGSDDDAQDVPRADFVACYPDTRGRYPDPCTAIFGPAADGSDDSPTEAAGADVDAAAATAAETAGAPTPAKPAAKRKRRKRGK
jgi:hypothetical protein